MDADASLDQATQEATLTFSILEGWVGATMDRADLEALRDQVLEILSQPIQRDQQR